MCILTPPTSIKYVHVIGLIALVTYVIRQEIPVSHPVTSGIYPIPISLGCALEIPVPNTYWRCVISRNRLCSAYVRPITVQSWAETTWTNIIHRAHCQLMCECVRISRVAILYSLGRFGVTSRVVYSECIHQYINYHRFLLLFILFHRQTAPDAGFQMRPEQFSLPHSFIPLILH